MPGNYYVYLMASVSRTLYVGVTNDLLRRVYEHRHKLHDGSLALAAEERSKQALRGHRRSRDA